ncbi:hypothetical protein CPB84DRAFT_1782739 [Gymnopilus junonius]|uniref:Uncharacterized protein n=1 Tax=Gymnopilus junonius TaxID=109634 RepID=A0A9P5NLY2_GYMJU|nr:hypothetical protein CPB84DRAFT_1782739 [Gymnopilus junonius]
MADSSYRHLFPPNPYPLHPPPPSIAHKVWILDCNTCSSFLTNRAMKVISFSSVQFPLPNSPQAVLLLRPNVSLYSSDVLPANCSPYSSAPQVLHSQPSYKSNPEHVPSRTCECLTQSLCCHTCGNPVGYMIVLPCVRCTSSVNATNRATNGHRFVFHSSEVVGTERHYVQGELGVIPFGPAIFVPPPPLVVPNTHHVSYPSPPYPHYTQRPSLSRSSSPPVFRSGYLPTPPLEFATPEYTSSGYQSPESHYSRVYSSDSFVLSPPSVTPVHYSSPHTVSADLASDGSSPSLLTPSFHPADQKEPPLPHTLKPGDVIFWHHLARSGETPGVTDDERARRPASPREIFFNR